MFKKISILVVLMLLTSGIYVFIPIKNVKAIGNTLYVGGSGAGNYSLIQDAIDNANSGDTIFVYSGIYYEHIINDDFNKTNLNLIGEDKNTTIIDGTGTGIIIKIGVIPGWFSISGFTIKNGSCGIYFAGDMVTIASCSIINNNFINNHNYGIRLYESDRAIIKNNTIVNNGYGVYADGYHVIPTCTISGNFIINNEAGISGHFTTSSISNNLIANNSEDGINITAEGETYTEKNYISNNTICNNTNGIYTKTSLYFHTWLETVNNLILTNENGIVFIGDGAYTHHLIKNNTLIGNEYGICFFGEIIGEKQIFNNFLENVNNAYDESVLLFGINVWNILKTAGKNIIDGPYLGGNYWDDYAGVDNDGDGLGDIPYDIPGGSNQDLHPLMYLEGETPILIDIKPGDYPNTINPRSNGKLPVAILTTDEFDANEVEPESIDFLGASPSMYAMEDVDNDGDIDMILHFKINELNFGLLVDEGGEYPYAYLYGETYDGIPIEGKDTVRLLDKWQRNSEFMRLFNRILGMFPLIQLLIEKLLKLD